MPPSVAKGDSAVRALVLYDGLCGFCDFTVHWVMKRDAEDRFRFAPQQSALATAVLARFGVDREAMLDTNSVYLVLNYDGEASAQSLLSRSDAQVGVLITLGGFWGILGRLLRAVPKPLRDAAYSFAARNRYRIAKRYESCPIPSPGERAKFVA
jgi:predicted DCC family thiol-disulfide oxidoreductase YuxK